VLNNLHVVYVDNILDESLCTQTIIVLTRCECFDRRMCKICVHFMDTKVIMMLLLLLHNEICATRSSNICVFAIKYKYCNFNTQYYLVIPT